MMMKRVHVIATGRVQGVGYRMYVQSVAEQYHLRGWVRNLPDGSVEAVAEGEAYQLDLFIEGMYARNAAILRVEHLSITYESPRNEEAFHIAR